MVLSRMRRAAGVAAGVWAAMAESHRENPSEAKEIEERAPLRPPLIYEIVRRRGDEEMERPATSLWWSGVAAGLSISFSLLTQAILEMYLPDAQWLKLVSSFGYSVGFLMVVLARQQLFTETTITAVLPVMADFHLANVGRMMRMWAIVWIANTVGTLVAAAFCTFTPVISPELLSTMIDISGEMMTNGWIEMFFKAISAGFIIAAMVWLIPSAESAQFWVVTLMTYLIAAGSFVHIVAGSVEGFLLVMNGKLGLGAVMWDFVIPALLGNIVGGTALFALIAYAQVMEEI
jgi:formate/nitrite transporter FocA (FNT family)